MKTFQVTAYRTVQDTLRATVEVQANDEAEALAKAGEAIAQGDVEFEFHQCGGSVGEDELEVAQP